MLKHPIFLSFHAYRLLLFAFICSFIFLLVFPVYGSEISAIDWRGWLLRVQSAETQTGRRGLVSEHTDERRREMWVYTCTQEWARQKNTGTNACEIFVGGSMQWFNHGRDTLLRYFKSAPRAGYRWCASNAVTTVPTIFPSTFLATVVPRDPSSEFS